MLQSAYRRGSSARRQRRAKGPKTAVKQNPRANMFRTIYTGGGGQGRSELISLLLVSSSCPPRPARLAGPARASRPARSPRHPSCFARNLHPSQSLSLSRRPGLLAVAPLTHRAEVLGCADVEENEPQQVRPSVKSATGQTAL